MSGARFHRDDHGSIPLALLAIIVVTALISVVTVRTVAQHRATRFDRDYQLVVQPAEAGVQEAVFRLNNRLITAASQCNGVAGRACGSGSVGGRQYSWTASNTGPGRWEVVGTGGGPTDVRRTLRAQVQEEPLFSLAAFSDQALQFNGGNSADSYHGVNGTTCSMGTSRNINCFGTVASNNDMRFSGNNTVDQVTAWNWDVSSGPSRCNASGNSGYACDYHSVNAAGARRPDIGPPYVFTAALAEIDQQIAGCTTFHSWTSASNGTVTFPFDGGTHCFDHLEFRTDTVLRPSVTPTSPLRILIRNGGRVVLDSHVNVNIQNCPGVTATPAGALRPCAARMYILTSAADTTTEVVRIRNHSSIAAGILAPRASCGVLTGSNAQVDIYGSLICGSIRNQGGWGFHYDQSLGTGLFNGQFYVTRLDEIATP